MKFIKIFNWVQQKFLYSFLYFYKNIYIYTAHKRHNLFNWTFYAKESLTLLKKNGVKLIAYILYLYIIGKFQWWSGSYLRFYNSSSDLAKKSFYYLTNMVKMWRFFLRVRSQSGHTKFFSKGWLKVKVFLRKTFFSLVPYFIYIYYFVKSFLVALLIAFFLFFFLFFFFQVDTLKQVAFWFVLFNLFFWLFSGFNFFLKRSRYGKFTGAMQRFWKRANMCFWLVEGFLFLIFYYYYLNSSQEPLYMYDQSSLNQEYLLSVTLAYKTLALLSLIVFILIFLTIALPSLSTAQVILVLIILSLGIFYMFFIESYQFYYVINSFSEVIWVYNDELNLWKYTYESPRLRTKHYYFLMCLTAKYWHFVFIFATWVFFLLKSYEDKRVRYPLLGYVTQNCIILYVLNLLTYAQWIKWMFHRFLDGVYFWFYQNYDSKIWGDLFDELKLLIFGDFSLWPIYEHYLKVVIFSTKLFLYGDNFIYQQLSILF